MDPESWIGLGIIVICLLLANLVAMADTALRFINRAKLQRMIEDGTPKARAIERFLERPAILSSTILLVNTIATMAATGTATVLILHHSPQHYSLTFALAFGFVIAFVLSQMTARLLAGRDPEKASMLTALPLEVLATVLSPLTGLARAINAAVGHILGIKGVPEMPLVTEEELRMMFDEEGVIEEEEREMIHGIFELEETTAREIMVPRIDIHALEANTSLSDAIDAIVQWGYSRIPVYESSIDDIIGVLYAKDLFKHIKGCKLTEPVRNIVRPAYFIPESKKIDELLRELQMRKVHIAIVVDEYGGTAGLVTIEDLLEEIVGEIQDEYDVEEAKIVELGNGEAIFDATVSIDDVNDTLGLRLEAEGVDTIGGLVYTQLGKMPSPGDEVRIDGVTITVLDTDGRRIKKIKVNSQGEHRTAEESEPQKG